MDEVTKKYECNRAQDPLLSSMDRDEGYQERTAFNSDLQRPRRDLPWLVAHVALLLASLAGGLVAWASMPRDARALASVAALQLAEEDSCPVGGPGRRHLMAQDGGVPAINYVMLGIFLLCGSLGIGWAFVLAFKHKPVLMVKASLLLAVITPAMGGISAMAQGSWLTCLVWLSITAFLAWIFYTWRNQIELVGRLLGVAGHAFTDTPELIGLSVGLQVLHWAAVYAPAASFLYAALLNGSVVANSARVPGRVASEPTLGIGGLCLDANDQPVACCIWQIDSWAQAYTGILVVTVVWSILLVGQIKLFTVGGAVAQWYFAALPLGVAPHTPVKLPVGRVQRSLRHALGPSLGSLCMGAAVLALVSTLRAILNSIERHRYVACCLLPVAWVLRFVLGAVEFLTRFTTIRLSLTGESFMDGARSTAALLKRNALDTLGMWWLPSLILKGSAIVMSLLYGWFMYGMMSVIAGTPEEVLMLIISWAISWMVLHFFCDLLLNVVDAVFLCYAMDRDMSKVTRQDVYDILKEVPGLAGPVVEQPDGGLAYGSPASTNARTASNV